MGAIVYAGSSSDGEEHAEALEEKTRLRSREEKSKVAEAENSRPDLDLLSFLDAEQEHLFLFPDDWPRSDSTEEEETSDEEMERSTRTVKGKEKQVRARNHSILQKGGKFLMEKRRSLENSFNLDNVDEVLRLAHKDSESDAPLRYTLMRLNPDGISARVATEDDVKNLTKLLSDSDMAKYHSPPPKQQSPSTYPLKKSTSQYKPGGPCDHCGVTESPQWRRGPPHRPQLCNACGTRFRRTNSLGPAPSNLQSSSQSSSPNSKKRDTSTQSRSEHPRRGSKEPKIEPYSKSGGKPMLVTATA